MHGGLAFVGRWIVSTDHLTVGNGGSIMHMRQRKAPNLDPVILVSTWDPSFDPPIVWRHTRREGGEYWLTKSNAWKGRTIGQRVPRLVIVFNLQTCGFTHDFSCGFSCEKSWEVKKPAKQIQTTQKTTQILWTDSFEFYDAISLAWKQPYVPKRKHSVLVP